MEFSRAAYKHGFGQQITTDAEGTNVDRALMAHFRIAAANVTAADTDGIHAAKACPAINVAAACVVKAASAVTDILTVTGTTALGASLNALSVLLTTAADDVLAVTKTDETKTINIALAKTTAGNNTAAKIQTAIRALTTVGGVSVAALTCTAGGNWDTAAVATGETEAVAFAGGVTSVDVIITGITQPNVPRNITATAGGTAGDIGAVAVTVVGTNYNDEVISETLPAFTANTAGTKAGTKAFKTITSISVPAHDGTGATTAIGFGEIFGLPYKLEADELVIVKLFDKSADTGAVVADADELEKNTFDPNGTPDGLKDIDLFIIV